MENTYDSIIQLNRRKTEMIANHYGLFNQLGKLTEECNELSIECVKSINEGAVKDNLADEIADVEILIEQIKHLANINDKHIDCIKTYKINRQLERIRRESDEKCIKNQTC